MTAFVHFAKRFSLIMMPLYSPCLTVQSGKTEMKTVNWSTCSGSQIYKENNSFDLSDCFALTERAEGTGPFLLPFFFSCFCSLAWTLNWPQSWKSFFGVTLIQGEIYPRTYNSELSRKNLKCRKQYNLSKHESLYIIVYINCWWDLRHWKFIY